MKKLTTNDILDIAKKNGYDKLYDLSKLEYKGSGSKICIVCPKHGVQYIYPFEIKIPGKCLCRQCKIENGTRGGICYDDNEFWKTVKYKHKDKQNLVFHEQHIENLHSYVDVECKIHGIFRVQALRLLNDNFQCKYCGYDNIEHNVGLRHYNEFINEAKKLWPNIDYSKTELPKKSERYQKYKIICPIHGEQYVLRKSFLKNGCPKCEAGINSGKSVNRKYSNEEFINELKKIYGDKYDYSEVKYTSWGSKVKLKCNKHGWFYREPVRLIHDPRGCPYCNKSLVEDILQRYFDENHINYIREYTCEGLKRKRIDFYLPDYNVGVECQGRQHFYQNSIYNINNNIDDVISYDKEKYDLCIKNNIKMYYFTNIGYGGEYFVKLYNNKEKLLNDIISENGGLLQNS